MILRCQCLFASALAITLAAAPICAQQATEIDNVAAFARLYGVARWFYPSDAAAALDWNRFAIDGVRQVRAARTPAQLETTLRQLFTPLGPAIEIGLSLPPKRPTGSRNPELIAWHYRGPGITEGIPGPYSAKRTNRSVTSEARGQSSPSVIAQTLNADALRGKAVRMRGHLRVANPAATGWAGMWLRVDRPGQVVGFFDNMQDRPVRETTWREYEIEGTIATDATQIVFGALSVGAMSVDVDSIEIAVRTAGGNWTPVAIRDPGFESTANSVQGWSQNFAANFTRPESGAAQGVRFVRITPLAAPGVQTAAIRPSDSLETPIAGAAIDIELARGLKARVPLSLTDAEARTESPALAGLRTTIASVASSAGRDDADVRLADAIVAWNVFRHFYPYWGDIDVNWDARLRPQLEIALNSAGTRDAHLDAVRSLVSDLNDGHGSARDAITPARLALLPIQFRILADRLVVTASLDASVPVGSVVTAIDGTPASARVSKETRLASGTPQWKRTRAESALQLCPLDATVTVTIEPPTGPVRDARLPCSRSATRTVETRPDSIKELQPGIWYVDLTRVRTAQLTPMLATIAKARGVIFDMRGYPTDAGATVLPYLMRAVEDSTDRWMHVPRFARPFGEVAAWQDLSWYLQPATPHIGGQRIFLTDGRAISYAESVMGYVRDYKLGTIIGGTTAGANGNVAGFSVPCGFSIAFTGMRVTRHDGKTAYHTSGVSPDIPLEPTLAGIRAGRDELLARALEALRIQP